MYNCHALAVNYVLKLTHDPLRQISPVFRLSLGLRDKSHDSLWIGTLEELRLKGLTFARIIGGLRFVDISNRRLWDACKYVDLPLRLPLSLKRADGRPSSYIS